MPGAAFHDRTGYRHANEQAGDKTISVPCLVACNQVGHNAPRGVLSIHSFAGPLRMRIIKAVATVLAIFTLCLLSQITAQSRSLLQSTKFSCLSCRPPHYDISLASPLLEVFQAYPPVLTVAPNGSLELTDGSSNATVKLIDSHRPTCKVVLTVHTFAFSYGKPFIGRYTPPACSFNRVTWNLTVQSAGRQFDRLGIVYLGDVEVFRTSTAEPTTNGIKWTYLKDMTNYISLLKTDQKVIFDLGNLVNQIYTAPFNVTLSASYFTATDSILPADLILPLSARRGADDKPSAFTVPPDTASNALLFPRNTERAVVTIAATGQSKEEFWWSNVLQSDVNTFPRSGELYGYSPFREIQLLIDGTLAGVVWPFPIIFTGGIVPGLWRPLVGIDAFDLKEDEIDITPWLPILCDGREHNFTIRVAGLTDDGNGNAVLSEITGSYWLVTGKAFLWLGDEGHATKGMGPYLRLPSPAFDVSSTINRKPDGPNETLLYEVKAARSLDITALIDTSHGKKVASWHQTVTFSNLGNFSSGGDVEINNQHTQGHDVSSSGYARQYSYPLYAYSIYETYKHNISIKAVVDRGKDVKSLGQSVFPTGLEPYSARQAVEARFPEFQGSWLSISQSGHATYQANESTQTSYSFGTTEQEMAFRGISVGVLHGSPKFPPISATDELFRRHTKAVNGTVLEDDELLVNKRIGHGHRKHDKDPWSFAMPNIPGRGDALSWRRT